MTDLPTDENENKPFKPPQLVRLTRDLKQAATTMSPDEARFLVDAYYLMQEDRKRAHNQVRAMKEEPHLVLAWLADSSEMMEGQIKRALDAYTDARPIGMWMKSLVGIGPVIAAGFLAHIDIKKAPTAGHIWRFAGLDPTSEWKKGQKRPWNASLKTLCWKVGQSFMKFSNNENCFYGQLYRQRKQREVERNESGANAEYARLMLEKKKYDKATDAYKALVTGKLPPAQVDARARRWVVKLFISHLQAVWWKHDTGSWPAKPYVITYLGHAHGIAPPNLKVLGFEEW